MRLKRITLDELFDFMLVFFIVARLTLRVMPGWGEVATVARVLFFAVVLLKSIVSGRIPNTHYIFWAGGFIIFSFLVSIVSEHSLASLMMLESVLFVLIDVGAVVLYCYEDHKIDLVFKALFITGIIIFIVLLLQFDANAILGRTQRFFLLRFSLSEDEHTNITGYNLFISLMAAYYLLKFKKLNKVVLLISIACLYFAIILTGTRKVLIVALVVTVLLFAGGRKKALKITALIFFCWLVLYLIKEVEVFYKIVGYRFFESMEEDHSLIGRVELIKEAFNIGASTIIGVGLNCFKFYTPTNLYAHNNILELFADLGFFGMIIFYSIHIIYLLQSWASLKGKDKQFWVIFIISLVAIDFGQVSYSLFAYLLSISSFSIGLQHKLFGVKRN